MSKTISALRNLGPVSESMLNQAGILTAEELLKEDPVDTFVLLRLFGFRVNKNMLWALYGAVNDVDWRKIDEATKKNLEEQLESLEKA